MLRQFVCTKYYLAFKDESKIQFQLSLMMKMFEERCFPWMVTWEYVWAPLLPHDATTSLTNQKQCISAQFKCFSCIHGQSFLCNFRPFPGIITTVLV